MEENFENKNLNLKNSLVKKANNAIKSNKCNQCDYASSHTVNLRAHLKTHSGEKSNKCNQCNYACILSYGQFEDTFENENLSLKDNNAIKSNKCSQCDFGILLCKLFVDTFENTQWRKGKQMQPM